MSRASGAGAYSHGMAWPSPRPQLFGVLGPAGTTPASVRVAMPAIMAPGNAPTDVRAERGRVRPRAAVACPDGSPVRCRGTARWPAGRARVLAGNLRDLRRVNRWLGGIDISQRAIDRLDGSDRDRSADDPRRRHRCRRHPARAPRPGAHERSRLRVVGLDSRPEILAAAATVDPALDDDRGLELQVGDGRSLPFEDDAFDLAHTSLAVHHLEPTDAVAFIREMGRVARHGVVVNDLTRGRFLYLGAWLLATWRRRTATPATTVRCRCAGVHARRARGAARAGGTGGRRPRSVVRSATGGPSRRASHERASGSTSRSSGPDRPGPRSRPRLARAGIDVQVLERAAGVAVAGRRGLHLAGRGRGAARRRPGRRRRWPRSRDPSRRCASRPRAGPSSGSRTGRSRADRRPSGSIGPRWIRPWWRWRATPARGFARARRSRASRSGARHPVVSPCGRPTGPASLAARVVVGADGAHSIVASAAGVARPCATPRPGSA